MGKQEKWGGRRWGRNWGQEPDGVFGGRGSAHIVDHETSRCIQEDRVAGTDGGPVHQLAEDLPVTDPALRADLHQCRATRLDYRWGIPLQVLQQGYQYWMLHTHTHTNTCLQGVRGGRAHTDRPLDLNKWVSGGVLEASSFASLWS